MTDPTHLPDDLGTSLRGVQAAHQQRVRDLDRQIAAVREQRDRLAADLGQERALRVMREEELRLETESKQQALELAWLKNVELSEQLARLKLTSPNTWADLYQSLREERDALRAVTEAVKALAKEEEWEPGNECPRLEVVIASLLALGPEWDWRKPEEPTP